MFRILVDAAKAEIISLLVRCNFEKIDKVEFLKTVINELNELLEDAKNGEI